MTKYDYKVGDRLTIVDKLQRSQAPAGRSVIYIRSGVLVNDWVSIEYEDGTDDYLTTDIILKFWGNRGKGTALWDALYS